MRRLFVILLIIGVFFTACFFGGMWISNMTNSLSSGLHSSESIALFDSKHKIGVIEVNDIILDDHDLILNIDNFRIDASIKAIILRINSPGGSVASSQEIFEAITRANSVKPVIASMGSVAASGGYYIACAASQIIANAGTTTGSIGVRMEHLMIGDLLKWAKVSHETITSGAFKDMLPLNKPMSEESRVILQGVLDDIHMQFKDTVQQSRKLSKKTVNQLADGRIYTGRQAHKLGLVDQLGGFLSAIDAAKIATNIKLSDDIELVYPHKFENFVETIFNHAKGVMQGTVQGFFQHWQPMMLQ